MNALTKALVVVVTILAVVTVALVVPFAARVPDYAQQYRDMKLNYEAQLEKASKEVLASREKIAAKGTDLEKAQAEIERLASREASLLSDLKAEQAKVAQANAAMSRAVAALEVATRSGEAKDSELVERAKVIRAQLSTLGELNGQVADLTQTIISVRAENRRLADNYLRIQEENKSLVTQLGEAQAKVDHVTKLAKARGIDLTETVVTTDPPAGVQIKGSVVKIDQVSDGLTFVEVNVGTRDQVKEGMEFTVYRGDKFVGTIKIASVDTAEAVGRLTLGSGVQEGDAIRAGGR